MLARGSIDLKTLVKAAALAAAPRARELDEAGMAAGLGQRLRSAGLPLDRLTLSLRGLHPEIIWRTVAWAPNEPVEIHDREYGLVQSVAFLGSPLRQVMETRPKLVVRVQGQSPDWMTMCFATAISLNLSSSRCAAMTARSTSRFLPPPTRQAFVTRIRRCSNAFGRRSARPVSFAACGKPS